MSEKLAVATAASARPAEAAGAGDGNVPSDFFHNLLHELRTLELERLPYVGPRVLSVGASGTWYFEWFEQGYGSVEHHTGIEAFEPEPPDLPPNVRWIPAPADRFDGVAEASVDVVFAGQTTEHLWANELVGFLLESHRVLRPGGMLALDSPNRLVTEHLHWSHGGHTVELSPAEITRLLTLSGFDPLPVRGAWLCQGDGSTLALEERLDDAAVLARRIALGGERPDDAFIWWVNAVRAERSPDSEHLRAEVQALFERHWPLRVCRGMPGLAEGSVTLSADAPRVASLPFPLPQGRWSLAVQQMEPRPAEAGVKIRILSPGGEVLHDLEPAAAVVEGSRVQWELDQAELVFACSLVVELAGASTSVTLRLPVELLPAGRRFDFDVARSG